MNASTSCSRGLLTALLTWAMLIFSAPPCVAAGANSGPIAFLQANDPDAILSPDQAFQLSVVARDGHNLEAVFHVARGHYLYRDRIKFESHSPGVEIADVTLPPGEIKQDATFGEMPVFHHDFAANIKLAFPGQKPDSLRLLATYQGCSDKGLCYAPIHKTLAVDLDADTVSGATAGSDAATGNSDDEATSLLKSGQLWLVIGGFFGFGLLLSLTPCMLPMLPILSGIIVGGHQSGRLHTFYLSLAYTLGMTLSYTLAGVAAGLSGHLLSNSLQNAWVLGTGAFIFVLLALSMFGFYELNLPNAFESNVVSVCNRFKGGRLVGVFAMGVLSALIVSPCVAAPLAGALLYISQTHDVLLGGAALFALSIGMGVPLLLIGASAGAWLPKAGPWMRVVRNFFGVIMLAVAVWLIAPVIPLSVQMALYAALLIIPAIYLRALDSLPTQASIWAKFWKGIGLILLITGAALLVGALSGAKSLLQPLAGLTASANSPHSSLAFERIKNSAELDARIRAASGKPVMLDFYADWCVACKEFERLTLRDERVKKRLGNTVLLQADVTQNTADDSALLARFALFGPPGTVFFDTSGKELTTFKVVGYQNADQFLLTLDKLGNPS